MTRRNHLRLRLTALGCVVLCLCARLQASTELAPGLLYLRPTAQLEALRVPATTPAAVIDLRAITASNVDDALPLLTTLKTGGTAPHPLLLVLITPTTPASLRTRLTHLPRCLTISRSTPDLKTDIAVTTTADEESLALAALAAGTPPAQLLSVAIDKPRYDESVLMREHAGAPVLLPPNAPPAKLDEKLPPPAPTPGADAVLLRAVHIYLGLVALKKI